MGAMTMYRSERRSPIRRPTDDGPGLPMAAPPSSHNTHCSVWEAALQLESSRDTTAAMLQHNTYFDGNVQSIGFERHGRRATVGVIDAGEFRFNTGSPERMTVVSG